MSFPAVLSIVSETIDHISDDLRYLSLEIHRHPELGCNEHFAHNLLTKYLETAGFTITRNAAGLSTAFVAEWRSKGADASDAAEPVKVAFLSE